MFEDSFAWIAERELFEPGAMGTGSYDLYALLRELGHYALAMGELDHAEQLYDRAREILVLETQTSCRPAAACTANSRPWSPRPASWPRCTTCCRADPAG